MVNRVAVCTAVGISAFFSQGLSACTFLVWNSSQYAQAADATYVGLIISKEPIGFAREEAAQVSVRVNYWTTVSVADVLTGNETDEVSFEMSWCLGGVGEVGERVVVFRLGDSWHVRNTEEDIERAKSATATSNNENER